MMLKWFEVILLDLSRKNKGLLCIKQKEMCINRSIEQQIWG